MIHRRRAIQGMAAIGALAASSDAFGFTRRRKGVKLRVLGTHVTLQEQIRVAAERDLGIQIEFIPGGSGSVLQRASTRPESFHVYEQWSNSINVLWRSGAIQPVDTNRIELWDEINSLAKTGRLQSTLHPGAGDVPNTLLYVQQDDELGADQTDRVSFLPYVHNADSFGYDTRFVQPGDEPESWGWLLDERWSGRVAIVNEPTIGLFDLALAARSKGLVDFENIGNMTTDEIDRLFALLIDRKRVGHFAGVWNSVPESVDLMRSGRAVIESMFSPGAARLRAQGVPVVYAAPKEGYRAWHGVMCLSSACDDEELEAAYAYMNWWLSGRPGALMAKQGYYMSVQEPARAYLSVNEWAYWYEGKEAREDILGVDGEVIAKPGDRRNGGSYLDRMGNVAVWNTVMDQYEYLLLKWGEFVMTETTMRGA